MKLVKFQQITRADIEKEAFDIQTNNGRALLLQDLLQSADRVSDGLQESEGIIFLKEVDGNIIKFQVVNQIA